MRFKFCRFAKMKQENVILVNEQDKQLGLMPKMEAHEKGVLHRAFSVFIFSALLKKCTASYHRSILPKQ